MNKTTLNSQKEKHSIANFYPRSPCGERHDLDNAWIRMGTISIHALLAESDYARRVLAGTVPFLSTLSLRRATTRRWVNLTCRTHFYPRSPCGERQVLLHLISHIPAISIHALLAESDECLPAHLPRDQISIHALLAESDLCETVPRGGHIIFLSTLSLRRATSPEYFLT